MARPPGRLHAEERDLVQVSKPGKTERALSAIVLLPIGQTWTRLATTLRDCIRGVRLLRALLRGEDE